MIKCKYCDREFTAKGVGTHQAYCIANPDAKVKAATRTGISGGNQYTKGAVTSAETRAKMSASAKKQVWSEDRRAKLSASMKRAVASNPESYSSANRGRTKQIEYNGIKFQGNWELEFYKFAIAQGFTVERVVKQFPYVWNGQRSYIPDFYIAELDTYVEVKGYETERDRQKWLQFPLKLRIIKEAEIKLIRKGQFKL